MAEIKKDPLLTEDANGDELATFTVEHTINDILRYAIREAGDIDEVRQCLVQIEEDDNSARG